MMSSVVRRLNRKVATILAVGSSVATLSVVGAVGASPAHAWERIEVFSDPTACQTAAYWYVDYKLLYSKAWCVKSLGVDNQVIWILDGDKI